MDGIKDSVVERSHDRYAQDVTHLNTYLGSRPVSGLTGRDVIQMFRGMEKDGHSTTTRHDAGRRLRQALTAAVRMGYVRKNVAKDVPLPRPGRKDIRPLSPAEAAHFLGVVREDRHYPLYLVALDSGAREGELLALEWTDWNPATRELSIMKTLVEKDGKRFTRQPKSAASRRRVVLSAVAAAVLEGHRQAARGRLVFPDREGTYYSTSSFVKYVFRPVRTRAGFPDLRFHDLRHTCATLLLSEGVDVKTVAERLGHANVTVTLKTYAHVLPSMRERAAVVLGQFWSGSKVAVNGGSDVPQT